MPQWLLLLPLKALLELEDETAGLPGSIGQPSGSIGTHSSQAEMPAPLQPEGLSAGLG